MMKKFLMGFLAICMLINTGCSFTPSDHKWKDWTANNDGTTHSRVCEDDIMHVETENHKFEVLEIEKQASDLQNGIIKYACSVCGYEKKENIAPTGSHNFTVENAKDECLKERISSATAVYYKSCADCGAYGNEDYVFEKTHLPAEYLELEYIKSTGNEYIDTGYSFTTQNVTIETKFGLPAAIHDLTLFGSGCALTQDSIVPYHADSYGIRVFKHWIGSSRGIMDITLQSGINKLVYSTSGNKLTCVANDETSVSTHYDGSIINGQNIYIFGLNRQGIIDEQGSGYNLYSFKMYDNNVLIRDFVPVQNINTGEIGLYDLVTEKLFTSPYGFYAGEKTTEQTLPAEYDQVEYIEGGGKQFIDTGINFTNQDLEVCVDFEFNQLKNNSTIFGSQVTESNLLLREEAGILTYYYGVDKAVLEPAEIGKRYNITLKSTTSNWAYNGNTGDATGESSNTKRNNLPIYLFDSCLNYPGGRGSSAYQSISANAKLYACSIKQAGVLVRNFVPCVRKIDNLAGLYDTVSGTFFTYSDTFTFGSSLSETISDRYVVVDYLESNGGQYIDTGFAATSGDIKIKMKGAFKNPNLNQTWFGIDEAKLSLNASHTHSMWQFGTCNQFVNVTDASCDISAHEIEAFFGAEQYLKIDDVVKYSGTGAMIYSNSTMTLFCDSGTYTDGRSGDPRYFVDGKLYYFQIYHNDSLVRDFVPCLDTVTNKAGLYDRVGGKFYANQNSKEFAGGDVAGHYFDEGTVITETSFNQDGHTVFKCQICGKEIHKHEESYAFKVSFEIDENIEEIKIYKDYDPTNYQTGLVAYSRNINTFNHSKINASVFISITFKDGYVLDKMSLGDIRVQTLQDGRYILFNIHNHSTISITSKPAEANS